MQMKNKVKSEKGIMTMYVTIAVVTFTIILVALFSLAVATRRNQIKTLIKVKEVYEQDNNKKEQIYLAKKEQIERQLPRTKDTVPYYPDDTFEKDPDTNLNDGLVIRDSNGNEYVWIEVPKSLYANSSYNTKTTTADQKPTSSTDYDKIEYCLHKYTDYYRRDKNGTLTSFKDTYYSDAATGLTSEQYYAIKQKMLKSVYENGGFYVGRYEAGIDTATGTNRTSNTDKNSDGKYTMPSTAPVTKADAYPYTYVTRTQAQNLASNVNSGTKTSSLMFGVQWDLVLAFMHNKGNIADSTLTSNSTTIGNYNDNLWTIKNANAKYSTDYGSTFTACPNPFKKDADSKILLTTGADSSFSVQNIYDIAGNVYEWTLEKTDRGSLPCAQRGGDFYDTGSGSPAAKRNNFYTFSTNYSIGFRVTLW